MYNTMGNQDLIQQLKSLRRAEINPRKEWLESNRALLLSQINNTLPPASLRSKTDRWQNVWSAMSVFVPQRIVYTIVRPMAVVVIAALIITTGSIGAVDAAYQALPGDWLYPAKRAGEKTQVVVAGLIGGKNAETKLHAEFAKRRAVETRQIITRDDPGTVAQVVATVADLKNEISTLSQSLNDERKNVGTSLPSDVVREVKQNAEQIKTVLQDVKISLNTTSSPETQAASQAVSETKDLVKDVSLKAVGVIVSKHLDGDQSISKDEVTNVLGKTIQDAALEAGDAKQNVSGVKIIVDAAKVEVKNLVNDDKTQGVTTTQQFVDKLAAVSNQTVAAVLKTEAMSAQVDKNVSEARKLLSDGDLNKVVDKLKEANETTKEAEKISDATLQKAQTVLPIVQVIKDSTEDINAAVVTTTAIKSNPLTNSADGPVIVMSSTLVVKPTSTPVVVPINVIIKK